MPVNFSPLVPVCQDTFITFSPFSLFYQALITLITSIILLKVFASIAKHWFSLHQFTKTNRYPRTLRSLLVRHQIAAHDVIIIPEQKLLAFTSFIPFSKMNGIFLSSGMLQKLPSAEIEAILLHELHHWHCRHPLKQLLLSIISPALFFVPIMRDLTEHWQLQSEIAADQHAIVNQGTSLHLKRALSKWLTTPELIPAWATAFSSTSFEKRIDVLNGQHYTTRYSKKRLAATLTMFVSFILVASILGQSAHATISISTAGQCSPETAPPIQSESDQTMSAES